MYPCRKQSRIPRRPGELPFASGRFHCMPVVQIILLGALVSTAALGQTVSNVASAGYRFPDPPPVAPGQIITLFVRGIAVPNGVAQSVPLPQTLSGVTVVVENQPAAGFPTTLPLFSVISRPELCGNPTFGYCGFTAVTVQVPFEAASLCINTGPLTPLACPLDPLKVAVQANGTTSQDFSFTITGQQAHVVSSCEFQFLPNCIPPAAKVFHADGTPLSPTAPAQAGEVVVAYAVGLGPAGGAKTGEAATSSV